MALLFSTNPAKNYKLLGSVEITPPQKVKQLVTKAQSKAIFWKELGVKKRTDMIRPLYKELIKKKKDMAFLTTKEIGKPLTESLSDLDWDEEYLKDFLNNGEKYLGDEITHKEDGIIHKIVYEPLGVAAVIVPWNFPFANFLWGVIPNLIAGNTVVFKHSEECPLVGKLIEEMMSSLELPEGVFSEIYGDGKVGELLVNQDIDLIWFTGSTAVGKKLYKIAGRKFIKGLMELGGSNPAIVFEDADVDAIINQIYNGRFMNCGQVCDAIKRLIVHKANFNETIYKLKKRLNKVIIGDPENKNTEIGSLVAR